MKQTCLAFSSIWALILSVISQGSVENDYYYRPYPVLIVHGFNADNKETWNVTTNKNKKSDLHMTTLVDYANLSQTEIKNKSEKASIVQTLIKTFDKNGRLPKDA
jgi:hypothetical protein